MDGSVSHTLYSRELRKDNPDFDFLVADPQPGLVIGEQGELRPGPRVEMGDVGYIHPSQGNVIILFNVHKAPETAGQPAKGRLPDDFEPLPPLSPESLAISHLGGSVIRTNSAVIQSKSSDVNKALSDGGSISFKTTSSAGAILVIPGKDRAITSRDATSAMIKSYMDYVKKNLTQWVNYTDKENLEITDLFVVLGLSRTTAWAAAAFASSKQELEFSLRIDGPSLNTPTDAVAAQGASLSSPTRESASALSWERGTPIMARTGQVAPGIDGEGIHTIAIRRLRFRRGSKWRGSKPKPADPRDAR